MAEIVKYELSKDGKGLLAYFQGQDGLTYYHIHSNELTELEVWIKGLLEKEE